MTQLPLLLAYIPEQDDFAARLSADLTALGHSVAVITVESRDVSDVLSAVDHKGTLLACLSAQALEDDLFRALMYLMKMHDKRVIPLLVDECDVEAWEETRWLSDIYPADFSDDYLPGLAALRRSLDRKPQSLSAVPRRLYIAHDPADRRFVRRIVHDLEEAGAAPWVEYHSLFAGDQWRTARLKALREADAVVVILSITSATDGWVLRDILLARSFGKLLIPIVSDLCLEASGCVDALYAALDANPIVQPLNDAGWLFPEADLVAGIVEAIQPQNAELPGAWERKPGEVIGAYELAELLGRGGMGEVYRGRHTGLGREVAIKMLPSSMAHHEMYRARFEREARTVAALRHNNIVQLYDFGATDNVLYMVMEYIPGRDLGKHLAQVGHLSLEDALPLLQEVGDALDYAHGLEIIHRDIKPQNIMLQPRQDARRPFRAVLTDFGMTKYLRSLTIQTGSDMIGTVEYMSPEQITDGSQVDHHADIYALGVVAYRMLTGKLPISGSSAGQILLGHVQQPPPDPRVLVPELPLVTAEAVLRALAKTPTDRFATAGDFVRALSG